MCFYPASCGRTFRYSQSLPCFYLVLLTLLSATVSAQDEFGAAVRKAISAVAPGVVRIRIVGAATGDDLTVNSKVTTGIVISKSGDVLTSVLGFSGSSAGILVEDAAGNRSAAKVVATDHVHKLVLLKCETLAAGLPQFASDRWPAVGAWSIAVGKLYPGAQPSSSAGIISATQRVHGLAIQTDAKISPVNYGGPLVSLNGEVLGILVPLSPGDSGTEISAGVEWYDSGIGFAIPGVDALAIAERLRSGNDLFHGVMGVGFATRNPLATNFPVRAVHPGSPADISGLQKGDQIVAADGVRMDRLGIFESVVKKSYAGTTLSLSLKRGDTLLERNVVLTDKLKRLPRGFLGIIAGGADNNTGEDNDQGVPVHALPSSPAAQAGLPDEAIVKEIDGTEISSVAELRKALTDVKEDQQVELTFALARDTEERSISITAKGRPDQVPSLSTEFAGRIYGTPAASAWHRQEEKLGADGAGVWSYVPKEESARTTGVVVLLNESTTPAEVVLNSWRSVAEEHHLLLVVPENSENSDLGREDRAVVTDAIAAVAKGRKLDMRRILLVAETQQALLCTQLLLDQKLPLLRAAVYIRSWPQVSGLPPEQLARKNTSVLIFRQAGRSRQSQALTEQAALDMRGAGVWTLTPAFPTQSEPSVAERIAAWALLLKAE